MRGLTGALAAIFLLGYGAFMVASTMSANQSATTATQQYYLSQATVSVASTIAKGTSAPVAGTTWTATIPNLPNPVTFDITAVANNSVTVQGTSGGLSYNATAQQ